MIIYESLQHCILPLVFETGNDAAPLTVWGTGFLYAIGRKVFFVTARHLINTDSPIPICVPSPSGKLVPIKDTFTFDPDLAQLDWADVVIHEADFEVAMTQAPDARVIGAALTAGDWKLIAHVSTFVIGGFPREHTGVDYDSKEVIGKFVELQARYIGPCDSHGLVHALEIVNGPALDSFAGFSGSPVFLLQRTPGLADRLIFCGLAIQGTVQANTMRFVSRSVITTLVESKRRREDAAHRD